MIVILGGKAYKDQIAKERSAARKEGYEEALLLIKRTLEAPEGKIITQPQTIIGSNQRVSFCTFIGAGITIKE